MTVSAAHTGADEPDLEILPGQLHAAREQITARRGLTGRWYKAEDVDELLDAVAARLAAVMGELERVRRDYARLADIDQARRYGALPTGMPVQPVDPDSVERRVREQDVIDRMLEDAAHQAAEIISDARHQYLLTADRERDDGGRHHDSQLRAARAEARLRRVTVFLEQWSSYLVERDGAERRAGAQRAEDMRSARDAATAMLAEMAAEGLG